jgi:hypothetical protein
MLGFKVSVEPNSQHEDADSDEGRAEGFTQVAQVCVGFWVVRGGGGERGVEAEELGDCDADGGEGEGGAEPGEEGAFCCGVSLGGGSVYGRDKDVGDREGACTSSDRNDMTTTGETRTQRQMIPRNTPLVLQFYTPVLFPKRAPSTAVMLFYRRGFAFRAYLIRIGFARRIFVSLIRGHIARRHRAIVSRRGLRVGCDGDCGVELGSPLAGSVGHGCTSQLSVMRFHLDSISSMATECRETIAKSKTANTDPSRRKQSRYESDLWGISSPGSSAPYTLVQEAAARVHDGWN